MQKHLTLYELNGLVRKVIETTLTQEYWVEAELSECRENHGHCYMELIEKDFADTSYLAGLQENLKEIDKRINNLLKAIEQGIITETTKSRLEELEAEKRQITAEIGQEELKKPLLSKERIMFWLYSFRNGSIEDENYKRTIIDTLVNSIYVYDTAEVGRKIVFTFNISGNNTTTVEGSSIDCLTALNQSNLNSTFFFIGHVFGFVLNIEGG